jgi:hypothetical protein
MVIQRSRKSPARCAGRIALGTILAVALGAARPTVAEIHVQGEPFDVFSHSQADYPDVALAPDGRFVVVWEYYAGSSAGRSEIVAQRFDADGEATGDSFVVPSSSAPDQSQASIAMLPDGRFSIVWAEGPSGVATRLFDRDGEAEAPAFLLAPEGETYSDVAPVVSTAAGQYVYAWRTQTGLRTVRVGPDGSVNEGFDRQLEAQRFSIQGLPDGNLALAWSHLRQPDGEDQGWVGEIAGQVARPDGSVVREFGTNPGRDLEERYIVDGNWHLSMAADAAGSFALTYDSHLRDEPEDFGWPLGAKLERFAPVARTMGSYFLGDVPPAIRSSDVAMTPGGNAITVLDGDRIYLRAFDCHGDVLDWDMVPASDPSVSWVADPRVSANERGDIVVTWTELKPDRDDADIVARRFRLYGGCVLCGDADENGRVSAADALQVLRSGVGLAWCEAERCDVDGSSKVGARDALRILRSAVSDGATPLPCHTGPRIVHAASATLPAIPDELSFDVEFSLAGSSGEAILVRESPAGDGSIVSQSIDADLVVGSAELLRPADEEEGAWFMSSCVGENGLAWTWSTSPYLDLDVGETVYDLGNVMLSIAGGPPVLVHPETFGAQGPSNIACLDDGRYAISWLSRCLAVRELDGWADYFQPEECNQMPADGYYLRFFQADGTPDGPVLFMHAGGGAAVISGVDGDRLVTTFDSTIQLRSADGDVLDEMEGWLTEIGHLRCSGTRCARSYGGHVLTFDPDDPESLSGIILEWHATLGQHRRLQPTSTSMDCDPSGTCVMTWILEDLHFRPNGLDFVYPGIYARAFDLETGRTGEEIRLQDAISWASGTAVVAIGPGSFVAAVSGRGEFSLHRIDVP